MKNGSILLTYNIPDSESVERFKERFFMYCAEKPKNPFYGIFPLLNNQRRNLPLPGRMKLFLFLPLPLVFLLRLMRLPPVSAPPPPPLLLPPPPAPLFLIVVVFTVRLCVVLVVVDWCSVLGAGTGGIVVVVVEEECVEYVIIPG